MISRPILWIAGKVINIAIIAVVDYIPAGTQKSTGTTGTEKILQKYSSILPRKRIKASGSATRQSMSL